MYKSPVFGLGQYTFDEVLANNLQNSLYYHFKLLPLYRLYPTMPYLPSPPINPLQPLPKLLHNNPIPRH